MKFLQLAIIGFVLGACSVFGYNHEIEEPAYNIVESDPPIEVREYEPIILASVYENGGFKSSQDTSFQQLFDYISGQNISQQKIEMTAPVIMSEGQSGQEIPMTAPVFMSEEPGGKGWRMSFVLPEDMTLETTPQPLNKAVRIEQRPAQKYSVIQFSGLFRKNNLQTHEKQLRDWIDAQGYSASGPVTSAGYNPPWTLPPFRRNEIHIPIQ